MDTEFDKEIDAMLRQLSKSPRSNKSPQSGHLGADEISAFAENALPANARISIIGHLADCDSCRHILSNFAKIENDGLSENIHAAEAIPSIPWYRKLFVFPNLAYSMGAVALLFAGTTAYYLIQQRNQADSSVASITEKQRNAKGASSEGESTLKEIPDYNSNASAAANSATSTANTAANAPASVSPNAAANAPAAPANADAMPLAEPKERNQPLAAPGGKTDGFLDQDLARAGRGRSDDKRAAADSADEGRAAGANKPAASATPDAPATQEGGEKNTDLAKSKPEAEDRAPEDLTVTRSVPQPAPAAKKNGPRRNEESKRDLQKAGSSSVSQTRTVSGKTFRNINGAWYDGSYEDGIGSNMIRPAATSVSRSSKDYKKLDKGLQEIGDTLKGTIYVTWSGKAYKIY